MAIKGSLKEASLPDVLQLLALGQKTGCLSIADRSNFGYIFFDKGRICYASIVNRRDRLGDILVKHARITDEQLAAAVHKQETARGKKLGEILVGMGVITRADLERSEEHTSELQSRSDLVCRLLLEKKKKKHTTTHVDYNQYMLTE